MPKITFIDPDGTERTVEAVEGVSVMQNAVNNDIPGIIAECGGEMNCATCHVYVEDEWASKLPEKSWDENDMLDVVDNPQPNSRLSCQLTVTPELDGLRVKVAGQTSLL